MINRVFIITATLSGDDYRLWQKAKSCGWREEQKEPGSVTVLLLPNHVLSETATVVEMLRESERGSSGDLPESIEKYLGESIRSSTVPVLIAAHGGTYGLIKHWQVPGRVWVQPLTHIQHGQPYLSISTFIDTPTQQTIDVLVSQIQKSLPLYKRISNLQHRLARLFTALCLDLDIWRQEGEKSDYGVDIIGEYSESIHNILKSARTLIYGVGYEDSSLDYLMRIQKDAQNLVRNNNLLEIDDAFQRVYDLVPRTDSQASLSDDMLHSPLKAASIHVFAPKGLAQCLDIETYEEEGFVPLWNWILPSNPLQLWLSGIADEMEKLSLCVKNIEEAHIANT